MSIYVSESFTTAGTFSGRTLDNALGGSASAAWIDTGPSGLTISGGQLSRASGGSNWTGLIAMPFADYRTEFVLRAAPTGNPLILDARRQSAALSPVPDSYRISISTAGSIPTLLKRTGGGTVTNFYTHSSGLAVGDRIAIQCAGSSISMLINGVVVTTVTDTSITGAGYTGFAGVPASVLTVDEFKVFDMNAVGTIASVLPPVTQAATGTVTPPSGGGQIVSVLPPVTQSATGTFTDKFRVIRDLFVASASTVVKMAMLGSSTTAGQNATDVAHRYVNLLAGALRDIYGAGGATATLDGSAAPTAAGLHVRNGGQGGTTSANYVPPARHGYLTTLQPQLVLHMIGSNDFAQGMDPATYKANVAATLDAIDGEVAGPVTHILVNAYQRWDTAGSYPFADYGTALSQIAAVRANAVYIDLAPAYVARGVPSSDPDDLVGTDNVHQGNRGHGFMASLLFEALTTTPVRFADVTSTLPPVTQTATGSTGSTSSSTGTITSTLPPITQSATGTVTPPVYTGTAVSTLPPVTQAATGTTAPPVFTGTATSILPAVTQQATGTTATPAFTGVAVSVLPPVIQSAAGTFTPPAETVTGVIVSVLPPVTQSASGTVTAPDTPPRDITVTASIRPRRWAGTIRPRG